MQLLLVLSLILNVGLVGACIGLAQELKVAQKNDGRDPVTGRFTGKKQG